RDEQKLRESEDRFRKIFEEGPLGMAIVSPDLQFLRVNSKLCRMLGYSQQELTGLGVADVTPPDDIPGQLQILKKLYNGDMPCIDLDRRYVRKEGCVIWAHLTAAVIRDEDGTPLCSLAMIEDITRRKIAEEALKESEERARLNASQLQATLDAAPAIILMAHDRDCRRISGNSAARKLC